MNALDHCFLYGIVDLTYVRPEDILKVTEELVRGGVDVLQLRAKQSPEDEVVRWANAMLAHTQPASVPLFLNNAPHLLQSVNAEGVHVGEADYTVEEARRLAGRKVLVGKSTHTVAEATAAQAAGADYVAFGPLFPSKTKPGPAPVGLGPLKQLHAAVTIPIFCVGGINYDNLLQVLKAGALRVTVVADILEAPNRVDRARALKADLG